MALLKIKSYSDLQVTVAAILNRRDLADAVPLFITLAEAELRRRLRTKIFRETLVVDAETATLPTACAELRAIYPRTSQVTLDKPLQIGTPEMLAETRARWGGLTGRPERAAIADRTIVFAPVPDTSYDYEVWFAAQVDALSDANETNWLLASDPDIYLFAVLLQAEPYLKNDERVELWRTSLDRGVEQLRTAVSNEENGASLGAARLPVVF
jgi:hypothetical protein